MFMRESRRRRRNKKRQIKDAAAASLLSTDFGQQKYWRELADECERSSLIQLLKDTLTLEGDVIECGVFRGASLRMICKTVKDAGVNKTVLGLDSFEGFPVSSVSGADTKLFRSVAYLEGKWSEAGDVPELLTEFSETFGIDLDLRKGFFEHTLPRLGSERKYCFVHLDCDTYKSHLECLDALYDKLVPGGVIVYDDFAARAWPGAKIAIEEFLADKPETVRVSRVREREAWYSVKIT